MRLVARCVSRMVGKTPGGFGTGFNFPKGDPRPVESRNSRAIGSTSERGEQTENVASLREYGAWDDERTRTTEGKNKVVRERGNRTVEPEAHPESTNRNAGPHLGRRRKSFRSLIKLRPRARRVLVKHWSFQIAGRQIKGCAR